MCVQKCNYAVHCASEDVFCLLTEAEIFPVMTRSECALYVCPPEVTFEFDEKVMFTGNFIWRTMLEVLLLSREDCGYVPADLRFRVWVDGGKGVQGPL